MTGCALVFFSDKMLIDMLRILFHNIKELFLAGSFIVSASRLHHMTRAVKLVPLQQVLPALISVLYREICIKIAVLILCGGYFVNKLIYRFGELFVGVKCQRISRRFYPLGCIAVLKYHSVKAIADILSAERLCGILKVLYNVALLRIGRFVTQYAVLIRNYRISYQFLIFSDKTI